MSDIRDRLDPDVIRSAHGASCLEIVEARRHKLTRTGNERIGPCPRYGGVDRFGINVRKNVWHCRQCGKGGDAIALVQHLDGVSFREAIEIITGQRQARPQPVRPVASAPRPQRTNSELAQWIWKNAVDPVGTLAEKYLDLRGISLDEEVCLRTLRFHPACLWEGGNRPCLVAAFRPLRGDPDETAPPVAISRIAINPDGSKFDRKMLGPVSGSAVKLSPDWQVESGLGICEGIETGLSIYQSNWSPIWALGSTSGIMSFPPLPGVEVLTIFADNDENGAGLKAAQACALVWRGAGCEVRIFMPDKPGADWNDIDRGIA